MYQGCVSYYYKVRYRVCLIIFMCKQHSCAGGRVHIAPSNIPSLTCIPSGKLITQSFGTLEADRSWKLCTRVY